MMRTALVTGANRGIGARIAHGLASAGLDVIAGVRNAASADDLLASLAKDGFELRVEEVDVGDAGSITALTDRLAAKGTHVDVLVNNAGILTHENLLDMRPGDVANMVAVNALGPLSLIQALAPAMVRRGYGRIVNVSSQWGSLTSLGPGAYGISKALLNAITVKVAGELPMHVKVNAMCPGWVHTSMGGEAAPRTPQQGADTAIWLATLPDEGPSGGYFRDRQALSWLEDD